VIPPDDDLILFSEDGVTWLRYRAWLALIYSTHPERLRDSPDGAAGAAIAVTDREEAKQWRAGRRQGLLGRTSPLASERRRKEVQP
jgi:hypothetical protein